MTSRDTRACRVTKVTTYVPDAFLPLFTDRWSARF